MGAVIPTLFVVAIGAALVRLGQERGRKTRARRHAAQQPARSPEQPLAVQRFDEMDSTVARARCPVCGHRLQVIAEGARSSAAGASRVVHTQCTQCEEAQDFFFDTSQLLH